MKTVIVQGSARKEGNTFKIVSELKSHLNADVIDLLDKNIGNYDYEHRNKDDDFLPTIKYIVANYDVVLFATPVYWYTMSGTLKIFFDRISDCLQTEKETGRGLKGKFMGAIACGSEPSEVEAFFVPFEKSAEYLHMNYIGSLHTHVSTEELDDSVRRDIAEYANRIKKNYQEA